MAEVLVKSEAGQLNTTDLKKIVITSLKVGVAAALTYFGSHITEIDLGESSVLVVTVITIVIDTVTRFLQGEKKDKE